MLSIDIEALLFRIPQGMQSRCRIRMFRALGMTIGPACRFERVRVRRLRQIVVGSANALSKGCWLFPIDEDHSGTRIRIGDYNFFNRDCMLDACNLIEIGDHNMFGPGVYITDSNHTVSAESWVASSPMERGRVRIGNGCWIGAHAVILKDVEIGDRSVVAAGAVVTKSFPPYSVVAGVPARLIRSVQ